MPQEIRKETINIVFNIRKEEIRRFLLIGAPFCVGKIVFIAVALYGKAYNIRDILRERRG